MSQSDFGTINPNTESGTDLATDLNDFRDALNSSHSGTSRPSYAQAGTVWTDTTGNPVIWYYFDGTDDIKIGEFDTSANTFVGETDLLTTANTFTKTQTWTKGSDVASASTLTLGDGNYFDVTGTTAITAIATKGIGTTVKLHFDGALTLTHHATDLILPGGSNITTAAGDEFEFTEYASGDWRCTGYALASGEAIVGGADAASQAEQEAGTATDVFVTPANQKFHRSASKAWACYTTVTTSALRDSLGISSLTDNGNGDTTLSFTNAFTNADYSCPTSYNLTGANVASLVTATKQVNSVQLLAYYGASGGVQDTSDNNIVIMGDLA